MAMLTPETTPPARKSEVPALARFLKENFKPRIVTVKGQEGRAATELLVLPEGLKAVEVKQFVDKYATAPDRREGTAKLGDLDSFIAHVIRFSDAGSALFADPTGPGIQAVLDYHHAGAEGAPRFGKHRAQYAFPLSDEWKAWTGANTKRLGQQEFAEFIENRVADLADPTNAGESSKALAEKLAASFASVGKLQQVSRGLSARAGAAVKNAVNLSSGEAQVSFVVEHTDDDGKPLTVPSLFLIAIPVFRSGAPYEIAVRLRYRIVPGAGRIEWFFEMYRQDKVFEHAFDEACKSAAEKTSVPLFIGSPEA